MKTIKIILHRLFFQTSLFAVGMHVLLLITYPLIYVTQNLSFSSALSFFQLKFILIVILAYIKGLYVYPMAFPKYNNISLNIKIISLILYTIISIFISFTSYPTRESVIKFYANQISKGKIELPPLVN